MASTLRWGGLRPEPYDPDAADADNDGIVQEGTAWERPAGTRLLDQLGREILRGATSTTRPAGLQYRDRTGKTVPYTPRATPTPGASRRRSPLARLGIPSLSERGRTLAQLGFRDRQDATLGRTTPNITDRATPVRPPIPEDQQALLDAYTQMRTRVTDTFGPLDRTDQAHAALERAFPNLLGTVGDPNSHFQFQHDSDRRPGRLEPHEQAYVTALLAGALEHPDTAASFLVFTNRRHLTSQGETELNLFGDPDRGIPAQPGLAMNLHPNAGLTLGMWWERKRKRDYSGVAIEPALREMVAAKTITKDDAQALRAAYVATHEFGHGVHFTAIARDLHMDLADPGQADENFRQFCTQLTDFTAPPDLTGDALRTAYLDWEAGLSADEMKQMTTRAGQLLDAAGFDGLSVEEGDDLWAEYQQVSDYAGGNVFEGFAESYAAERFGLTTILTPEAQKIRRWTKGRRPARRKRSAPDQPASSGLARLGHQQIGAVGKIGETTKKPVKRPVIGDLVAPEPKPFIPPKPAWTNEPVPTGVTLLGPSDVSVPSTHDLDMGVVLWRQGEPRQMRDELENVLAGRDVPWDGNTANRARMAALMNAVADAPLTEETLYRGESVTPSQLDTVIAELVPGATFTTDMRGYSRDRGAARNFAKAQPTPAHVDQIIYEVEPGARALRLDAAVPLSRHYDQDILEAVADDQGWVETKPITQNLLDSLEFEDEHIALGTYEVTEARVETIEPDYFNGLKTPARRLVVQVRQTEALGKPDGGWDAPQAPPAPEIDAATQSTIDKALARVAQATNLDDQVTRSSRYLKVEQELRIYTQMAADADSDGHPADAARYRTVIAALKAEGARLRALPAREDMADEQHDPESVPNKRRALQAWIDGQTDDLRGTLDDLLGGPDDFGKHTIRDPSYDTYLKRRTRAAAILQEYTDAGWEHYDPLYRGEGLLASQEEVLSEIYPVGKEFTMPLRGFSRKEHIADGWSGAPTSLSGSPIGTGVLLQFKEGSMVKALPLYEMWDDLGEEDENEDAIEFLRGEAVGLLSLEDEHLVAGTVRVVEQEVLPDGRVKITLEPVAPLEPPEGGKWR